MPIRSIAGKSSRVARMRRLSVYPIGGTPEAPQRYKENSLVKYTPKVRAVAATTLGTTRYVCPCPAYSCPRPGARTPHDPTYLPRPETKSQHPWVFHPTPTSTYDTLLGFSTCPRHAPYKIPKLPEGATHEAPNPSPQLPPAPRAHRTPRAETAAGPCPLVRQGFAVPYARHCVMERKAKATAM